MCNSYIDRDPKKAKNGCDYSAITYQHGAS